MKRRPSRTSNRSTSRRTRRSRARAVGAFTGAAAAAFLAAGPANVTVNLALEHRTVVVGQEAAPGGYHGEVCPLAGGGGQE
ncbi:hypothetical protein ACH4UM_04570 [Streptomyces sp. NPDC020801]|uniref:hypothetical protein n=1 Tax=unclassified Streptomyces TaxID=2593676 RepID=UPI0037A1037D